MEDDGFKAPVQCEGAQAKSMGVSFKWYLVGSG